MNKKSFFITVFFAIISPLIHGYYYNVLDHHHYLPYLNKLLNPSLYVNDYYFSQPHFKYTLFNHLIVFIKKTTNLSFAWIHLIIFIFSLWLLYYAIYRLSFLLFKNRSISTLSMALFLLPKWAGSGYQTHRFYFTTRDLSTGLSVLSLSLILTKKFSKALILIIITFLINPTVPIPIFIFWLFLFLKPFLKKLKLTFPAFFHFNTPWLKIIQSRGTYSFPHLWHWTAWGNVSLIGSLLVSSFLGLKRKIFGKFFNPVSQFIGLSVCLFLFNIIFTFLLPAPQIIQLQLVRVLNFIAIFALISFSALIYQSFLTQNKLLKIASISAALGVYFWSLHLTGWHFLAIWLLPLSLIVVKPKLTLKSGLDLTPFIILFLFLHAVIKFIIINPSINLPHHLDYPNPLINLTSQADWRKVQVWANKNTPVEAVFLTSPKLHGFRVLSERSIIGNRKDGGLVFYSEDYAFDWKQRMDQLKNYHQFNVQDFTNLHQIYSFDYLVVSSDHQPLSFNKVYSNSSFVVFKM